MCLIVFAYGVLEHAPLVLGANRDEAHARKTLAAHIWEDAPTIAGGRDLERGGSWLLVSRSGRLAAITNHRRIPPAFGGPSRGWLVRDFVTGNDSARDYVHRRHTEGFASFNLLVYDGREMWQLEDDRGPSIIEHGIHGLSNARLDDPWPKVTRTTSAMKRAMALPRERMVAAIYEALGDRTGAPDPDLPDTGVGVEIERVLAPPFIVSPVYGTRSSSVVVIEKSSLSFEERSYDPSGAETNRVQIAFELEPKLA
jgi:uncharacterized protein with NRDE domain